MSHGRADTVTAHVGISERIADGKPECRAVVCAIVCANAFTEHATHNSGTYVHAFDDNPECRAVVRAVVCANAFAERVSEHATHNFGTYVHAFDAATTGQCCDGSSNDVTDRERNSTREPEQRTNA